MAERQTSSVSWLLPQALSEALFDGVKLKLVCATRASAGREALLDLQVSALEVLQMLINLAIKVKGA